MTLSLEATTGLWIFGVVQLLGVVSAWLARLSEGSSHQSRFQWLFFLSLVVIGATTTGCLLFSPRHWLAPAFTLAIMILVVVCDFSRAQRPEYVTSAF